MKTLILILFSFTCLAQQQNRKFGIVEYTDTSDSIVIKKLVTKVIAPKDGLVIKFISPPDSARLLIPNDGFLYETTMSFRRVGTDSLPITTRPIDNIASLGTLYTSTWTHTTNQTSQWFNKTLSWACNNAAAQFKIDWVGTKIDWFSEKMPTHGQVAITIDGGAEVIKDQNSTTHIIDAVTGIPSFTSGELPQGNHTMTIRSINKCIVNDYYIVYSK